MIEASLAIGVIFFCVFLIVDGVMIGISWLLIYSGLYEGMQVALQTPNIDNDTRAIDSGTADYQYFALARRRALHQALRFPIVVSGGLVQDSNSPASGVLARLLPLTVTDLEVSDATKPTVTAGVALLRPGQDAFSAETTQTIPHTTDSAGCNAAAYPASCAPIIEQPMYLLSKHPIQLVAYFEYRFLNPFMRFMTPFRIIVTASERSSGWVPQVALPPQVGESVDITATNTTSTSTTTTRTTTTLGALGCTPDWKSYFDTARVSRPQFPRPNTGPPACGNYSNPPLGPILFT